MSINRVVLVGYLGQDPILRSTPSGKAVGRFSLATNARWYDGEGKECTHTEWHQVVVWGKIAESCHQHLTVGRLVYVEGSLHTRQYEDKEGQPRSITEVTAQRVVFLGMGEGPRGAEPQQGRADDSLESAPSAFDEVPW